MIWLKEYNNKIMSNKLLSPLGKLEILKQVVAKEAQSPMSNTNAVYNKLTKEEDVLLI